MQNKIKTDINGGVVTFTRIFDAPRELVWEAWTNPEHIKRWWGPNGFSLTIQEMAVMPEGVWRFMMHGPDGTDYPNKVQYEEVIKPEKLVYRHTDDDGDEGIEFQVTVLFLEKGDSTKLIMSTDFGSQEELERLDREVNAIEGGKQTLTRLADILPELILSDADKLIVKRKFDAPIELVWEAITDEDHMRKWYFDLDEFKPEVGFTFRFPGQGHKGEKYMHVCKITEVVPYNKLQYSWEYENLEGKSLVTFELFKEENGTLIQLTHEGLESFPDHPDFAKDSFNRGWTQLIGKLLKEYVEKLNNQ